MGLVVTKAYAAHLRNATRHFGPPAPPGFNEPGRTVIPDSPSIASPVE